MKHLKLFLLTIVFAILTGCTVLQPIWDFITDQADNGFPILTPTPTSTPILVPTIVVTPDKPTMTPTPRPSVSPTSQPSGENPNVNGAVQYFGDGPGKNLWKPVSDTSGNLVIVLASIWKKEFNQGCTIDKNDGTKEKLFCGGNLVCFGNPDSSGPRLHLRTRIKCDKAAEVKVTCVEDKQTVIFTLKDKTKLKEVCKRWD